jgi:hypothetical protein
MPTIEELTADIKRTETAMPTIEELTADIKRTETTIAVLEQPAKELQEAKERLVKLKLELASRDKIQLAVRALRELADGLERDKAWIDSYRLGYGDREARVMQDLTVVSMQAKAKISFIRY